MALSAEEPAHSNVCSSTSARSKALSWLRRAPFLSWYVASWLTRILFVQRCGRSEIISLPIIDPEVQQRTIHFLRLDKLTDRALPEEMCDLIHRSKQSKIDLIAADVLHKRAVDFHDVYRQISEVTQRRKARSKIIERESAAELSNLIYDVGRLFEIFDKDRLSKFKTRKEKSFPERTTAAAPDQQG